MMKKLLHWLQEKPFFRREPFSNQPITLTHKRIFILPTRRGMDFVIILIILLLIAFIYNNNLGYLLSFLLASVFFVSIIHTFKSLSGLLIYQGQATSVFAGENAGFDIHVSNLGTEPRFNLQLHLIDDVQFSLNSNEKRCVTLYSPTQKRGWHSCSKIELSSTYPLGLFRAWSVLRFDAKALVYPKPAKEIVAFPENAGTQNQLQGSTKSGYDEFYGLKEYQNGDSIRHIHWKAFAKGLGLLSKQYSGETFAQLWLNYDAAPGHDTEQRLSQLCRWLVDADKAGLHYGFILPGVRIEPSSGTLHFKKCLEALALF
jgi:uncharacterized protein (DUF58 family)